MLVLTANIVVVHLCVVTLYQYAYELTIYVSLYAIHVMWTKPIFSCMSSCELALNLYN